jgi:hypothetical protein
MTWWGVVIAMTPKRTFATSPRHAPEVLMKSPPKRGRGERRVPAAPAASCALVVVESTRVTTSTPESPDVPARNGFTAYFALSPVTGLFATVAREYGWPAPGRADQTSANLTPASGRQDHTTSPYAATSLVRVLLTAHGFLRTRPAIPSRARRCRVHRIPCPTSVTIAKRPSVWDGMTRLIEMFLPTTEAKYFCKWD